MPDTASPAPALPAPVPGLEPRLLSFLVVGVRTTLWHYDARGAFVRTPLAITLRPGFFNPAQGRLRPGDRISVSAADGGADLYVMASQGGEVNVAVLASTGTLPIPTHTQEAPNARAD